MNYRLFILTNIAPSAIHSDKLFAGRGSDVEGAHFKCRYSSPSASRTVANALLNYCNSASSGGFASIKSFEVGLHLYCMCIFPAFTFINFHSQWRGCYTSHVWSQRCLSFASSVCDHCCETHRPPYSYLSGLCIYLHTFTDGSRYDSISVVLLAC